MTQQVINVGAAADDGTGDPLRTAFIKSNSNFTELYGSVVATLFSSAANGLTPASGGGAVNFLRADGTWTLPVSDADKGDITVSGSGATWTLDSQFKVKTISAGFDGGGAVISSGTTGDIIVPQACTIDQLTMVADQSGSIVIDIWKDTYANFPPSSADSITASSQPTISSATKSQSSAFTGWTTTINAGDILRFRVDSATSITRVTMALKAIIS